MKILLLVISIIIPTAIATWFLLDEFVCGRKAQIKRLWGKVFFCTHEIAKWEKMINEVGSATLFAKGLNDFKARKKRIGKLINALLDYYYVDTENENEQEYVEDNRYKERD